MVNKKKLQSLLDKDLEILSIDEDWVTIHPNGVKRTIDFPIDSDVSLEELAKKINNTLRYNPLVKLKEDFEEFKEFSE